MKRRWEIVGIACMALICAGIIVRTQRNNRRLAKWAAAELAIAEDCRQLAEQGDLTSASIRYQQMVSESKVQFPPARLGRYRR